MIKFIWLILFLFLHIRTFGQDIGTQHWIQTEARKLQNMSISLVTSDSLDELHGEMIIEELRKRSQWPLLIRLRDEETITQMVSRYIELEGKSEFLKRRMADSRSPWLLPFLAPILNENPSFERRYYGEHGENDFGYPHLTADLIRQIIHNSPEFPEEVRISFTYNGEDPWLLAGIRRWWTENTDAITKEKYSEVSVFDHSDLKKENILDLYGLEELSPITEPFMEPKSMVEPTVTPSSQKNDASPRDTVDEASVESNSSPPRLYLVVAVCLALLSYIYFRRKNFDN